MPLAPHRPVPQLAELLLGCTAWLVGAALAAVTIFGLYQLFGHPPGRYSPWRAVLEILVLCGAWVLTNGPVEGRLLWAPLPGHGVTQADLAVLPALLVAGLLAVLQLRS